MLLLHEREEIISRRGLSSRRGQSIPELISRWLFQAGSPISIWWERANVALNAFEFNIRLGKMFESDALKINRCSSNARARERRSATPPGFCHFCILSFILKPYKDEAVSLLWLHKRQIAKTAYFDEHFLKKNDRWIKRFFLISQTHWQSRETSYS